LIEGALIGRVVNFLKTLIFMANGPLLMTNIVSYGLPLTLFSRDISGPGKA
jgi:hypothetical protein